MVCSLTGLPSDSDQTMSTVTVSENAFGSEVLVLQAADTLSTQTTVTITCSFGNNVGPVTYQSNVLTALTVGSVTAQ